MRHISWTEHVIVTDEEVFSTKPTLHGGLLRAFHACHLVRKGGITFDLTIVRLQLDREEDQEPPG